MNENEVKKFIVEGEVISVPSVDVNIVDLRINSKVYQWAQQPEKPQYTAQEVGALPNNTSFKTVNNESIIGSGDIKILIEKESEYDELIAALDLNESIKGVISEHAVNEGDMVYAFYRNTVVGYSKCNSDGIFYLTVCGNISMSNKTINFKLIETATNKIYEILPATNIRFAHGFVYGCGDDEPINFIISKELFKLDLYKGWQYVSLPLNIENINNGEVNSIFSGDFTDGDLIKDASTRLFCTYENDSFLGNLTNLTNLEVVSVYVQNKITLYIDAENLSDDDMNVSVRGDGYWSLIPCVYKIPVSITQAFSQYTPSLGDLIKSKNKFCFYNGSNWEGDLTHLNPGEGYYIRRIGQGTVSIHFPAINTINN